MAETDVNVRVVSEAQAKGFKDAEKGIDGISNAANKAKPKVDKAGKATAAMGQKSKVAGARVGGLVQAMLRGLGITTGATEASIAAGEAQEAMGDKARIAGAAIGIAAVAVAVLLPLLLKLVNRSKEAAAKLKELRQEMIGQVDLFREAAEILPDATGRLEEYANITEELALIQQSLKILDLRDQINKLDDAQRRSVFSIKENVAEVVALTKAELQNAKSKIQLADSAGQAASKLEGLNKGINAEVEFNKRAGAQREANRKTIQAINVQLSLLEDAQLRGTILSDEVREKVRLEREERRLLAEQIKKEREERESLDAILGIDLDREIAEKERKEDQAKKDRTKSDINLAAQRLSAIERERDGRIKAGRMVVDANRRGAAADRATTAGQISASAGALSQLFGQNKSFLIAAAIADTFAGANSALATVKPWPAAIVAAAISIATGLANVASIRSQELGFDNPFSDRLADRLGVKFADDMLNLIAGGFQRRVAQSSGAAVGGPQSVTSITQNTGPNIQSLTLPGFIGAGKTEFFKGLNRELIKVQRLEGRTRIGRSVQ